ncbi:HlyD family efflux transporter periplasmic adaptor subunit [Methyloligella sp. 2.7D]|uniref:HlyD family secretion protein n=1 Tax=unclassified Methyloligella TaxID=2625955 RepID=UPI00157C45D3|nr:HlyD family efflux transporter periplasmic adaptor subunit [Methyloligella sp. GL2]QKP77179.1 HlyD family efflux transporter periplasmic adaptor subunit [Methyloligella sp. GL2]
MLKIHKRPRIDKLVSEQRVESASWGRRIYLALLAVLAIFVLNYLFGDMLFLRAEGILLTDRAIVAADYPGRVVSVEVKEGQAVEKGDVLLRMESAQMVRDIAELTLRSAEVGERNTELKTKLAVVEALLPIAERHVKESETTLSDFDRLDNKGLISSYRLTDAVNSKYQAAERQAELKSQAELLRSQVPTVSASFERANSALSSLERLYDGGVVRAFQAGIVGPRVPSPGRVVQFGDDLLEIHGTNTYVLAYLPNSYLFSIEPGEPVTVKAGSTTVQGHIEAVLPVADALPPEFQNMFRPRDRSRLMRISLDARDLAVSQKVSVRGCWWLCERPADSARQAVQARGEGDDADGSDRRGD